MISKSFSTNLISIALIFSSFFTPTHSEYIFSIGIFALSGAITNWLAVHMLFEKVPLLYGSGVIPSRFEDFKGGIKRLIITEFFDRQHIEKFFINSDLSSNNIVKKIDTEKAFEHFVDAIQDSSLGGMLNMFGGKQALEPLKEPVMQKIEVIIDDMVKSENFGQNIDDLVSQVEKIIDNRLNELTPQNVKTIVHDMIHKHLGWLVVWGGCFGGLIGLIVKIAEKNWI